MQLEDHRGLRWLYLSLFLRSGLSASVTDPTCACSDYGSCNFTTNVSFSLPIKRNVAVGKKAKMSSVFNSTKHNETSGPACLAVNGKTDTTFRPVNQFPDSPNCIHTGDGDRDPYWEVDLGQPYSINSITVYWRSLGLQKRSDGVNITVDEQLCLTVRSPVSNPSHITCSTQLAGQTVRLAKTDHTPDGDYYLTVCEVEVWVCWPGFFGTKCQYVCPEPVCRNNHVCSPVDGTCPKESYSSDQTQTATTTEVCCPGFFGTKCQYVCPVPVCKNNQVCSPVDGTCPKGLTPATCDITKLVFPVVGGVLAGSVVNGICIAAVLWLKRSRDRRLGLTAEARGAGGMVTELGDVGTSEVRAQSLGPRDNQTQGDYVNLHEGSDVAVQGRKGNKFIGFPTRKFDKSGLSSDLSDDEEYVEMK